MQGWEESRPELTGAEPVILSDRPACPLQVVGLASQKEEAILGAVGSEGRICFHISELWVFGLVFLYFVDFSEDNHSEPLWAVLEVGVRTGTVVPSNQAKPMKERGTDITSYCSCFYG